ncbi:hypothetical protein PTSG_12671 [Salpingoeca rosetta]|uniref:UBX domain-containing protein n=1 Tax=Salpingoeca rosetta (strain ATCC 50818 / BSB-021) TaxID=946362 RepID=F2UHS3_SALR5|nr:uncharacterized protein PTSG_12671 [Salpingoeca rosetta]EGD76672.1 hypothetical protein PTSG_12671 [Salpingoeca rosetta]|eukprot:XP_004991044.1 hypothetical protein PTSG_12671 [Salpingoeca rosetta]
MPAEGDVQTLHEVTQLPIAACQRILSAHNNNLQAALEAVLSNAGADGDLSATSSSLSSQPSVPRHGSNGLRRRTTAAAASSASSATAAAASSSSSTGAASTAETGRQHQPSSAQLTSSTASSASSRGSPATTPTAVDRTWRGLLFSFLFDATFNVLECILSFFGTLVPGLDLLALLPRRRHQRSFVEMLPDLARGAPAPAFADADFDTVKREANRQCKLLLVYLHAPRHADADSFVHDTLCAPDVVAYLNETFVLWGCNAETTLGRRLSRNMQAATFPFVGVLLPKSGTPKLVAAIQGALDAATFLAQLRGVCERVEPLLVVERTEREQRMQTQRLREEQDQAYQESLRKDRERQRLKEEEERRAREEEEAAQRAQLEEQQRKQEEEEKRKETKTQLPPEPQEDEERILVAIKLPDGSRVKRHFRPSEQVKVMYDFVFSHHDQVTGAFTLYTMRPRRPLSDKDARVADFCPNNAPTMFTCHLDDA